MTKNTLFRILKLSSFSLLFFLLYFLLSSQSSTPVYATSHAGCSISASSVEAGKNISVTHGGFAEGEKFVIFGGPDGVGKFATQTTQESLSALRTQSVTVPADTPLGADYFMMIRTRLPIETYTCAGGTFTVTTPPKSCGVSTDPTRPFLPDPVKPGDTFIVSGLGFDPAVSYHSVSLTGYYGNPEYELGLMSYNPATGAWSSIQTVPATAPGRYVVRVDSTVCYPTLDVESGLPPLTGKCAKADVNGDGTVTVEDANEVLLHFGDPPLGSKYDVNGDGGIDLSDATEVLACVGATGGGGGVVECTDFLDCVGSVVSPSSQPPETLVGDLVTKILPLAIALGGMVSVIMIVVSGIQFITSSGNPDGAAAARGRLTFSIIGFVLLVLAFVVTRVIDSVFLRGSGIF